MTAAPDEGGRLAPGTLAVVSTPIGNLGDLSPRALATLREADVVCCEDTRHTGLLLKRSGVEGAALLSLHAHNEASRLESVLELLREGRRVALVSDAGTPLVSDPGERLVAAAVAEGLPVTAVPGPSALLAALVVSGMGLGRFSYEGFLPRRGADRERRLKAVAASEVPVVCYEAPTRIEETVGDLARACGSSRRVLLGRELTKLHEEHFRGTLGEAAAHLSSHAPRGEYVLVVGPGAPEAAGEDELAAAMGRLLEAGLSRRDAAAALSALYGVSHKSAYAAALATGGPTLP